MAENAMAGESLVLSLTYRNKRDGSKPDGARAFNYAHVQKFLKRVRDAYVKKYGEHGQIRYLVAGERGSKKDRVHWHVILFADKPVSVLGRWWDFWWRKIAGNRLERMDHWSMWDHGHVVTQAPDAGGMRYVLKYAFKDQFNEVRARGTMRFAKSEHSGASYFRMSKVPPIGMRFIKDQLERWRKLASVPPSLVLRIPGHGAEWWPKGLLREALLDGLHQINEESKAERGRDCPQWNTLMSSVEVFSKDWEILTYGKPEEGTEENAGPDEWSWQGHVNGEKAAIRRRCGGIDVCAQCYRGGTPEARKAQRAWHSDQVAEYVTDTDARDGLTLDEWFRQKRQINPFCYLRNVENRCSAFGYSARQERYTVQTQGPRPGQDVQRTPGQQKGPEGQRR